VRVATAQDESRHAGTQATRPPARRDSARVDFEAVIAPASMSITCG
jgi:hypothetical protein